MADGTGKRIVVLGAGVAGLTAARELLRRGHVVHLLERAARPGGAIRSTRRDGWLVEAGPNTLLVADPSLLAFFDDLGLGDALLEASPAAHTRYIVRDGVPVAVPTSPATFVRTALLGTRAKLRLLAEPLVRRAPAGIEESVADFGRRRLGAEVVDYAIDPLIGGIFAGDPALLSIRHAFPTLHGFERAHGSLVLGAIAAGRARRRSGVPRFRARSISFREGLQSIVDALAGAVGDRLLTNVRVEAIDPGPPWRLRYAAAEGAVTEVVADALVVAVPGHAAAALPFATAGRPLAMLGDIAYPPVTSVAMGFRREQVAHPLDGYGMLVPAREGFHVLGTLFSSALFPGRAPDGHVLLTSFVGGMRQPALARLPDAELCAAVLGDLARLLGVRGEPAFTHVTAWRHAIPQYDLGYDRVRAAIETAEARLPGLLVGGHVWGGASVGDCIRAGVRLADRAA